MQNDPQNQAEVSSEAPEKELKIEAPKKKLKIKKIRKEDLKDVVGGINSRCCEYC